MKMVVIGTATSGTSSPATMFQIAVQRWQEKMARLFEKKMERLFNPYRPERHYMRGPGPKCREKHSLSERALKALSSWSVLRPLQKHRLSTVMMGKTRERSSPSGQDSASWISPS